MCGLVGFWSARDAPSDPVGELRLMAKTLAHRGPDDAAEWWDPAPAIGFGFRRLSIQDLSPEGRQPMTSVSGRYVIVFNGEVYNFAAIRAELEERALVRAPFRGHSDTEVMLAAIEAWGLEPAVTRFLGMFAFALWDRDERELHLVRDRAGVKPLYFGQADGRLVFGSELKPLVTATGFSRTLDERAVAGYLRYGYVSAPRSIYAAARKVMPGTIATFSAPSIEARVETRYWSAVDVARAARANPFTGTLAEATDELDRLLHDAVKLRLVSDVPLGAFLSGGIDSSVVTAIMQAESSRPVKTFSIGNADRAYDESAEAAVVARHLGTDHTAVVITAKEALDIIPELPRMYDEPFADSSQLPTFLVSRIARREVTVALSGDGGDEVFGGYNRHVWGPRLWPVLAALPEAFRALSRRGLLAMPAERWDRLHDTFGAFLPSARLAGQKAHKLARLVDARSERELYRALCSSAYGSANLLEHFDGEDALDTPDAGLEHLGDSLMLWDFVGYLPDDIMTKVDRASMAVSLEAREPLLDHRLVDFSWRLPHRMKIEGSRGKLILRNVLRRYLPSEVIERPKMGFSVPMGTWLRGPLREWASELLEPRKVAASGVLRASEVSSLWKRQQEGKEELGDMLWNLVVFQSWLAS